MKKEITDKNHDLIFKLATDAFRHKLLKFLKLDAPEIKAILPTELPDIIANIKHTDLVFRLADESLLHLEFQSNYISEDTYRFLTYDARLHKKYRQKIRTVVIYTREAAKTTHQIAAGSITYNTETISIYEYDGDKIHAEERRKIVAGQEPDLLKLMFLPLMNSTKPAAEQTKTAVELLKQSNISEEQQINLISGIIVLVDKILSEEDINNIWEEINMLRIIQFAEKKGMEKGMAEGMAEGMEKGMAEGMEKGMGKGMQDIIYKQLLIKFKDIPADYKEKLKSQDQEKLEIIGMKIMEIKELDELKEYLS